MDIALGQIWKDDLGGIPFVVVGFEDENFVLVKRADYPKKMLAHTRGASPVPRSFFATYSLIKDAAQRVEP